MPAGRASEPAGMALEPAGRAPKPGGRARWEAPAGGTDGRTDGRKISPFYRTSSTTGAAAQKPLLKNPIGKI